MFVSIQHENGSYPSFTIHLHSAEGAEPFLSIKKCKTVTGKNGEFISYPAQKNEQTGKWYPYLYGGEKFNAHVLKLAQVETPKPKQAAQEDSDIPF